MAGSSEAQNLTDEEIYRDVLRPGSALSALSEESPMRSLRPQDPPSHLRTSRFSASPYPSRYLQDSALKPSDFTFTRQPGNTLDQLAADLSAFVQEASTALEKCAEAKHRLAEEREAVIHLAQQLASEEAREVSMRLDRHKEALQTLLADLRSQSLNAVRLLNSREASEAVMLLARQKAERALAQLRQELSRRPLPALGTEILSKQASEDLRMRLAHSEGEIERLRTIISELEQKKPQEKLADSHALEQAVDSLRRENTTLSSEKNRLEEENLELRRSQPTQAERMDAALAARLEDLTQRLQERWRGHGDAWRRETFRPSEDLGVQSATWLTRLKDTLDTVMTQLEAKLKVKDELSERVLVSYKQSALSELRNLHQKSEEQSLQQREQVRVEERQAVHGEVAQLREANQKLSDILASQTHQLSDVREKYDALSVELGAQRAERAQLLQAKENELREMRTAQEAELERRLRLLQLETEADLRRAREQLERDLQSQYRADLNDLQSRNQSLEHELIQTKQDLQQALSDRERLEDLKETLTLNLESDCARKLEQMRRVYTDKYDELFRITTAQINELEMKVQQSEHGKALLADTIKNKVLHSEEALRARQLEQQRALHRREMEVLGREVEDFVRRAKAEVGRLAVTVEETMRHSGEQAVLRGLKSDLSSLAGRLEFRIRKPSESLPHIAEAKEEDSVQCALLPAESLDMRVCKRCGSNDKADSTCRFHPFLAKVGAADFLYGSEWHRCREEKHNADQSPCLAVTGHYYGAATPWSPNAASSTDSLGYILNQDSLRPDGFTFAPGKKSPRRVLDSYEGPEKEKIRSAVKDLKQRSARGSRKVSPSQSQANLQATGAFTLPVQTSPDHLTSALFESEKHPRTTPPDKQSLRIPGAHTVLQKHGDSWETAGLPGEELLPSEQLAQYLSRGSSQRA